MDFLGVFQAERNGDWAWEASQAAGTGGAAPVASLFSTPQIMAASLTNRDIGMSLNCPWLHNPLFCRLPQPEAAAKRIPV